MRGLIDYKNVPRIIGAIVSSGKATLLELTTDYGARDAYDLWEIVSVDYHNERKVREHGQRS